MLRNLTGLEIRERVRDVGSYSKLIWALQEFPNDTIITADDDVYYRRDWLELLLQEHKRQPDRIVCHLAREIGINDDGTLKPYNGWKKPYEGSERVFPLTGGGCLYPPGSLHKDVINVELFTKLAPKADDIWFWAMGVLNGTEFAVVPNGIRNPQDTGDSGGTCLWSYNCQGGNDMQLKQGVEHYPQLQSWLKQFGKTQ